MQTRVPFRALPIAVGIAVIVFVIPNILAAKYGWNLDAPIAVMVGKVIFTLSLLWIVAREAQKTFAGRPSSLPGFVPPSKRTTPPAPGHEPLEPR
jgi:hypothetical protein